MGRRRKGRAINGVVLLNKGLDVSSNNALQQVKRLFGAAKAGHTGALDPLATGMLPICLGEATKFSQFLLDSDKTYQVTGKLGIRTTTSDADGDIIETRDVDVSLEQLKQELNKFLGPQKQVPTMFSALKYQGKPLYHYARQGIEVPREARDIHFYRIDLLGFEDNSVTLNVHCSKGTYIRTLIDDLGQALGCGAYVTHLHRSAVAGYPADAMLTIEQLQALADEDAQAQDAYAQLDDCLLPMDSPVTQLEAVTITQPDRVKFCNGNPVLVEHDQLDEHKHKHKHEHPVRVYDEQAVFLGVGTCRKGELHPKRLVVY